MINRNTSSKISSFLDVVDYVVQKPERFHLKSGPGEANGLFVSTTITPDHGHESALRDKTGNVFPVERYDNEEKAILGHEKWKRLPRMVRSVTKLGWLDFGGEEEVTLIRYAEKEIAEAVPETLS